jgi:hypothetical protein
MVECLFYVLCTEVNKTVQFRVIIACIGLSLLAVMLNTLTCLLLGNNKQK